MTTAVEIERLERKPAECAVGDGQSIVLLGERIGLGTRVVLWNEPSAWPMDPLRTAGFLNAVSAYLPHAYDGLSVRADAAGYPKVRLWQEKYGKSPFAYPFEHRVAYPVEAAGARLVAHDVWFDRSHPEFRRYGGTGTAFDAYARSRVKQFTMHHDAVGSALGTYHALHGRRGLSVHFTLHRDGTIYQWCDLAHSTLHVGGPNAYSIGVEIAHHCYLDGFLAVKTSAGLLSLPREVCRRADNPVEPWYTAEGTEGRDSVARLRTFLEDELGIAPRPLRWDRVYYPVPVVEGAGVRTDGFVFGRVRCGTGKHLEGLLLDYSEQQKAALAKLVAGVCGAFGIPVTHPAEPGRNPHAFHFMYADPAKSKKELRAFRGAYRGVVGHQQVTEGGAKFDPNWAFEWEDVVADARRGERVAPPPPPLPVVSDTVAHAYARAVKVAKKSKATLKAAAKKKLGPVKAGRLHGEARERGIVETVQSQLLVLFRAGVLSVDPGAVTGEVTSATRQALLEFAGRVGMAASGIITGPLRARLWDFCHEHIEADADAGAGRPDAEG
ncbi:MAG TPA: N-acetylmuramoyl-L-alanine amidase [Myxococcota bacterium]|jgi:hypothetical protein|nr:N-acetylmuramoyl-L-alanine amidase [Myxococcota bacterium]